MSSITGKLELLKSIRIPPIVEAVLDIDCDLAAGIKLEELHERAVGALEANYPVMSRHFVAGPQLESHEEAGQTSRVRTLKSLHFARRDGLQVVQLRAQGFTFNRLAPYSRLDDYMGEIEDAYGVFRSAVHPVEVKKISLRYINRIMLPLKNGSVELNDYLETPPRVPGKEDGTRFSLRGFLHQDEFVDRKTGNQVNRVLSPQPPERGNLPLIFDNSVSRSERIQPEDWQGINDVLSALRSLKNEVFADTLTEQCLRLFQ